MQVAQEVRRVLSSNPSSVKLKQFLLKPKGRKTRLSEAELAQVKSRWLGLVGLKPGGEQPPPQDEEPRPTKPPPRTQHGVGPAPTKRRQPPKPK